jgi:hypothetical protein
LLAWSRLTVYIGREGEAMLIYRARCVDPT